MYMPRLKSKVKKLLDLVMLSSAARRNLTTAASSRKPITTLIAFIHEPARGIVFKRLGNRARTKNGDANAAEKASTGRPRIRYPAAVPEPVASTLMKPP